MAVVKRTLSAYLLALISGTQSYALVQADAQHLRQPARHRLLVDPLMRKLAGSLSVFPQQFQDDLHAVADRQKGREPFVKIEAAHVGRFD